VLME